MRKPLPAGTLISYCDITATVIEDSGFEMVKVKSHDNDRVENWLWDCNGIVCKVIGRPDQPQYIADKQEMDKVIEAFDNYAKLSPDADILRGLILAVKLQLK